MVCSLQATTGEYMSLELLSLYTDVQISKPQEKKPPKTWREMDTRPLRLTHLHAKTHTRMEWNPANTSALPAKQDQANIAWNSV